jgi:ubiquitin-protein ligase
MVVYLGRRLMIVLLLLLNIADAHFSSGNDNHGKHHHRREESDVSSLDLRKKKTGVHNISNISQKRHFGKRIKSKKITIVKHPTMNADMSTNRTQGRPSNSNIFKNETSIIYDDIFTQCTNQKQRPKMQLISSIKQSGGKDGASLRRIKREWKDAVKLGIAYDWQKGETVKTRGRSPSSKSIQDDGKEYLNYVRIGPLGKSLLRWHFSVKGPSLSVYAKGVYHGRILLPKDYPLSPPRVQMLTPSGRFISGEDICLTASAFHPETWTPRWTILSLVDALRIHMLTNANEIGGIDASSERRRQLALESRNWKTDYADHGKMIEHGLFHDQYDDYDMPPSLTNQHAIDEHDKSIELNLIRQAKQSTMLRILTVASQIIVFTLKHPIQLLLLASVLYLLFITNENCI